MPPEAGMQYDNFDVWVDAEARSPEATGRYRVWAACAFGETPRQTIVIEISDADFRRDLDRLEGEDTDEEFLIDLGSWFFRQLVSGPIETLFEQSFTNAEDDAEKGLRLRLRFTPPEISALP